MKNLLYIFTIAGIVGTFNVQGMQDPGEFSNQEIENLNKQILQSNLDELQKQRARDLLLRTRKIAHQMEQNRKIRGLK